MRVRMKKSGASVVLGLLLVTIGCNDLADDSITPDFAPLASVGDNVPVRMLGTFNDPHGNGQTCDPTGAPDEGTGDVHQSAQWIDRQGGYVVIYGTSDEGTTIAHVLAVPKNAVREKTLFCMRLYNGSHMQVKLKALALVRSNKNKTEIINIGKDGFREPVQLYMSYHQARVVRVGGDGQPQLSPLTTDEAQRLYVAYEPDAAVTPTDRMQTINLSQWDKYIVATLPHFSKYVMMLD